MQTRSGESGLKPLKRGVKPIGTIEAVETEAKWVLAEAWGPNGKLKRANAEGIRDKMREAWDEGGEAAINLKAFLDNVL